MLVAMRELDVGVGERVGGLLELLEADDGDVLGRVRPGVVVDELAADTGCEEGNESVHIRARVRAGKVYARLILLVVKDALLVALDKDFKALVNQLLRRRRRQRRPLLERLLLAAQPELRLRRHVGAFVLGG